MRLFERGEIGQRPVHVNILQSGNVVFSVGFHHSYKCIILWIIETINTDLRIIQLTSGIFQFVNIILMVTWVYYRSWIVWNGRRSERLIMIRLWLLMFCLESTTTPDSYGSLRMSTCFIHSCRVTDNATSSVTIGTLWTKLKHWAFLLLMLW